MVYAQLIFVAAAALLLSSSDTDAVPFVMFAVLQSMFFMWLVKSVFKQRRAERLKRRVAILEHATSDVGEWDEELSSVRLVARGRYVIQKKYKMMVGVGALFALLGVAVGGLGGLVACVVFIVIVEIIYIAGCALFLGDDERRELKAELKLTHKRAGHESLDGAVTVAIEGDEKRGGLDQVRDAGAISSVSTIDQ